MAKDFSKLLNLGASNITLGGVNLGHTDADGAKISIATTLVEAMVGQYGQVPVRVWINGQRVTAEFNLTQTVDAWAQLALVLPGATKQTNGADNKLTFGVNAGTEITGGQLIFKPIIAANTPAYDFTLDNAIPVGDWEQVYSGAKEATWAVKFEGLINEAGGVDTNWQGSFGKDATTADVTNPTATVVPLDDAAAVNVATTVVWTCSEDMDGNTVNTRNVLLIEDAETAAAGAVVAGTVVLSNAGAATTITFTPDANLTAASPFTAILTAEVKDLNGNIIQAGAVDGMVTNFATA